MKGASVADNGKRENLPGMLLRPFRYLLQIINFLAADIDDFVIRFQTGLRGFRVWRYLRNNRSNSRLQPDLAQCLSLPTGGLRFFEARVDSQDLIASLNLKRNYGTFAADNVPTNAVHHPVEPSDGVTVDFENFVTGLKTGLSSRHIGRDVANDRCGIRFGHWPADHKDDSREKQG